MCPWVRGSSHSPVACGPHSSTHAPALRISRLPSWQSGEPVPCSHTAPTPLGPTPCPPCQAEAHSPWWPGLLLCPPSHPVPLPFLLPVPLSSRVGQPPWAAGPPFQLPLLAVQPDVLHLPPLSHCTCSSFTSSFSSHCPVTILKSLFIQLSFRPFKKRSPSDFTSLCHTCLCPLVTQAGTSVSSWSPGPVGPASWALLRCQSQPLTLALRRPSGGPLSPRATSPVPPQVKPSLRCQPGALALLSVHVSAALSG